MIILIILLYLEGISTDDFTAVLSVLPENRTKEMLSAL